ncbi:MAG: TonB-dependent receptor [Bacteroidota bacterium]
MINGRNFFSLLLLLLVPYLLSAQNSTQSSINGYVRDGSTGETLLMANVALMGTTKGATTNTSGYYTINNIPPGEYVLVCRYIGYQPYDQEIIIGEGENLRVDIEMQPEDIQLEEVVVESKREREEQKNIGVAQLQTKQIKELPSVLEADVFRSVQLLPGVKAASDFSSGLYIRGGSPDQTLILLDRTTVYNPTHFFGFFSTFNPDAIKDVRLYKGGYPAEYGGRLGSVLDIYNKDGNRKEFTSTVSMGLLASRVSLEGPYDKGSWMIAARRSTLEPVLAALRGTVDNIPDSFYFFDINGKINFDANPNNKFSLAFYSGSDQVLFPFAEDAEIDLDYGNQTISGNYTHIFGPRLFGNLTVTGSRYFNFPAINIGGTPIKQENNIFDASVKADLEFIPNDKHEISTGIWGGNLILKYINFFDGAQTFYSRTESQYASFYLQDIWKPADPWKINAGVRVNGFSAGEYIRIAPRLSVEYQPNERWRFQTAYGRYQQFLTLITNESFSGFDQWLTVDEGVAPSWGDQFILGVKHQLNENWAVDTELYYRTMRDLFELDPFIPDRAGLDYADLFRFGKGYAYGAELKLEKGRGRLTGYLGYTLGVTRRKYPQFNTSVSGSSARYYPPKYDRLNDVNLVANYQLNDRWKATAVFSYATGQAYTKPLGRTQVSGIPWDNEPRNTFVVGKVNAERLPAYHRLDIGFSRNGTFFDLGEAEWQFQIINVYSRRNVWYYNYDFDKNPVERDEVTLLPILPTISYTVTF